MSQRKTMICSSVTQAERQPLGQVCRPLEFGLAAAAAFRRARTRGGFSRTLAGVLFGLLALWPGLSGAQATDLQVTSQSKMQFVSDAPLERFTGTSRKLSGTLSVDPAKLAGARGSVRLDMSSIRTGIDLRDEHLRGEDWLDAKGFPYSEFVLEKVEGAATLKPGVSADLTLIGKFTLHGVTRPLKVKATARWVSAESRSASERAGGDQLRIKLSFPIKLDAHKISINSLVRLKVSNEITVNLDLVASAGA